MGKHWGLTPKVCRWIYQSIILPIITYGSIVWLKSANKTSHMKQLGKIQRRCCLATLNTMRSTPTAGMEVIMNIRPIDIVIKEHAVYTYTRMKKNGNWRVQDGEVTKSTNHSVMVKNIASKITGLEIPCDTLKNREYIESSFKIQINKRSEFKDKEIPLNPENYNQIFSFTDGSKKNEKTGCGYITRGKNYENSNYFPLDKQASVFQAEILAIQKSCEKMLQDNIENKEITFYIDSQSAIKALDKYIIKSKLVSDTKNIINRLAEKNEIILCWIPSHQGYLGNEIADRKAKLATKNPRNKESIKLVSTKNSIEPAYETGG